MVLVHACADFVVILLGELSPLLGPVELADKQGRAVTRFRDLFLDRLLLRFQHAGPCGLHSLAQLSEVAIPCEFLELSRVLHAFETLGKPPNPFLCSLEIALRAFGQTFGHVQSDLHPF